MAKFDLRAYAKQGAAARVVELNAELAAIYKAFPDLRAGSGSGRGSQVGNGRRRKRKEMLAAQKAEVSRRMKKYWAERRRSK